MALCICCVTSSTLVSELLSALSLVNLFQIRTMLQCFILLVTNSFIFRFCRTCQTLFFWESLNLLAVEKMSYLICLSSSKFFHCVKLWNLLSYSLPATFCNTCYPFCNYRNSEIPWQDFLCASGENLMHFEV